MMIWELPVSDDLIIQSHRTQLPGPPYLNERAAPLRIRFSSLFSTAAVIEYYQCVVIPSLCLALDPPLDRVVTTRSKFKVFSRVIACTLKELDRVNHHGISQHGETNVRCLSRIPLETHNRFVQNVFFQKLPSRL